ncbi:XRE family transcriptional regulator [Nitrosospira lacus]|uniref:Transcriptional regulator n=1 Tax=Nitrosospira lacus TaxID=1288494 RepID=A0A1W6SQT5_9PROT|nr:helix-turn-helix transcriptional regulator [Nitrosospira lacus]ARO88156.1 XRE family transcriptional regulator [Nitrosospira lacus]
MQPFYERLIEERKRLGLTQDEMAHEAGVAKRTYCNYEAGISAPTAVQLGVIALIGVDVQYVMTGNRQTAISLEQERAGYVVEVLSKEEQALLDNYRNSPPEGKTAIKAVGVAVAKSDKDKAIENYEGPEKRVGERRQGDRRQKSA